MLAFAAALATTGSCAGDECADEVSALQVQRSGKSPCDGLYGAEALTCAWEADAKACLEEDCKGCSGTQCLSCKEDPARIKACCDKHWHSTTPPEMCAQEATTAAPASPCDGLYGAESLTCVWGESVKACMEESCHGCGGTQCLSCKEDPDRIKQCCDDHWHSTTAPEQCKPFYDHR